MPQARASSKRRNWWLAGAVLLFAAAAYLMNGQAKTSDLPPPARKFRIPNFMTVEERARLDRRRVLPKELPDVMKREQGEKEKATAAAQNSEPPVIRDPLLRALPTDPKTNVVIIEANALRHSALGEELFDCLATDDREPFDDFTRRLGINPLEDIDRIAIMDGSLAIAGNFRNLRSSELFNTGKLQAYGDKGQIYENDQTTATVGLWDQQLILLARDPGAIPAALDRIEGRMPYDPPLSENDNYGEIYGNVSPQWIANLLPSDQADLASRIPQIIQRSELHVDAMDDVGVVMNFQGNDQQSLGDLATAIGVAFSLSRVAANMRGDPELAALLENAEVSKHSSGFQIQLALPHQRLEEHLKEVCAHGSTVE